MKRLFRLDVLLIIVVPSVNSLAVAVGTETGNFAGLVDIGTGRKMYLKCSGTGSPTVVLVGGPRASADDWGISDKSKPMVIAAGKLPADIPPDFGYITDAAQKKAQDRLAKLMPNEKHITKTNSGHEIHKEQPQLVIDAIREVVEAVDNGRSALANFQSAR